MPEHVHWLIYPQVAGTGKLIPISTILLSLKTSIARQVSKQLAPGSRIRKRHGMSPDPHTRGMRIWTTRGIDVNIHTPQKLRDKLDYCHANPVQRGLVDRPEQWTWSSYAYYQKLDTVPMAMDWEGSWPLL